MATRRGILAAVIAAFVLAGCGSSTDFAEREGAKPSKSKSEQAAAKKKVAAKKKAAAEKKAAAAGPSARLIRAMTETSEAGTARIDMDMSMSIAGEDLDIQTDGVMDLNTAEGELTMTMPEVGEVTMRIVDGAIYMQMPQLADQWIKAEMSDIYGEASGISSASTDPTQMLSYLAGVSDKVDVVGHENVRGVDTTHYHAVLDMSRAFKSDQVPAEVREQLRDVAPMFEGMKVPVDVWIDADNRVRRETLTMNFGAGTGEIPAGSSATITMDMYDFGVPVDVQAPPPDQTMTLDELQQNSGSSLLS